MELVGVCVTCQKTIYCRDGFLDGVVDDDKQLYCHACFEEKEAKNQGAAAKAAENK